MSETELEEPDEQKPDDEGARWAEDIRDALKVEGKWRKQADRIVKRYREEDRQNTDEAENRPSRFNILFANISVEKPSIFQVAPRPDVRRRFDPQGSDERAETIRKLSDTVSTVIERAISHEIDRYDFAAEASDATFDGLCAGRGVMRVRYAPTIVQEPEQDPVTGEPVTGEDGEPVMQERIADESCYPEQVYWKDFTTAPHRKWSQTDRPPWIAFRHLFDKAGARREFGERADTIKYGWRGGEAAADKKKDEALGRKDRAEIWEIWDYESRKVLWLAFEDGEIIDRQDDPLELAGFYPCAAPFFAIKTTDTLVPVAEYRTYADLAYELDCITQQISVLTRELKVKGLYDASMSEVKELLEAGTNEMIPVKNFGLTQGQKLADAISFWPLEKIVQALAQLLLQRDAVKQTIYEVIGISDILRGSSNPNETLGAQRIKTQFGTLRIDDRRRALSAMFRDVMRIMAEIVATRFQPDTLMRMTGMEIDDAALKVLRDDIMRSFVIDVETDSTVVPDESAEQEATSKILIAVTQFIEVAGPLVQQGALTAGQAIQMLRFAISPFRKARSLDAMLDEAERRLEAAEAQPQEPSPEEQKQKAEADKANVDLEKTKIEADGAAADREFQIEMQKYDIAKAMLGVEAQRSRQTEAAE